MYFSFSIFTKTYFSYLFRQLKFFIILSYFISALFEFPKTILDC